MVTAVAAPAPAAEQPGHRRRTAVPPGKRPWKRLTELLQLEWADVFTLLAFALGVGLLSLVAPAAIEALPKIRAATDLPLIFDSGIEGGLDILRARALGADLVMLGRAPHYALAALGDKGPAHLIEMLKLDLQSNMGQIGARSLDDLPPPVALAPLP